MQNIKNVTCKQIIITQILRPHSMLFAIVIRNRYRSRTRKIVNLIFYAHRYRKVISNSSRVNESC